MVALKTRDQFQSKFVLVLLVQREKEVPMLTDFPHGSNQNPPPGIFFIFSFYLVLRPRQRPISSSYGETGMLGIEFTLVVFFVPCSNFTACPLAAR